MAGHFSQVAVAKPQQFTLVTRRPYCPGRPKELCFTTLSLAMETMGMRLSVVKQRFFGPPGQYGRLVTRANVNPLWPNSCYYSWACRQSFLCLRLHSDEAYGSIQWKMTHKPRLHVKTADNCNNSHLTYKLCLKLSKLVVFCASV